MPFKTWSSLETLNAADTNSYLMTQMMIRCTSSTRPAGASEGWHIYETDTQRRLVYRNGGWWPLFLYESQIVVKTKDDTQNAGNDVLEDSELQLELEPNATYWFDAVFDMHATTNDVDWGFALIRFVFPDNSTVSYAPYFKNGSFATQTQSTNTWEFGTAVSKPSDQSAFGSYLTTSAYINVMTGNVDDRHSLEPIGLVKTPASFGENANKKFHIQWACWSQPLTSLTMHQGSYIHFKRLA